MLQPFQVHIQKWCKTTDKILLAVSGGMDSMVMLKLFHQADYSMAVAHCNFQLRGVESDEDENFVRRKCHQWDVAFYSHRFDTNNYASEKGLSIQMAARELRYAWFDELLQREGFDRLATAHHLNDSIETILLNLTKGVGIEGLMGIPIQNKKIIRPLLFATRQEIENYAAEEGIAWREDESNESDDYQRNFIRHRIVPKLKEINPSLEKTMQETIYKLQGASEIISVSVEEWKQRHQKIEGDKIMLDKKGVGGANALMLWEVIKSYGFNFDQSGNIIKALSGQSGKRFSSGTHELIVDRENLVLVKHEENWMEVSFESDRQEVSLGNKKLTLEIADYTGLPIADKNQATVDEGLVQSALIWRKWRAGDFFFPLGMKNRKKISDFLIDEKISLADKDSLTVLECNGEIVWVVGHRLDDRFKVTDKTKRVIKISLG
ncbi:MAG: tRNA lysidine(34) synthetase TilS [Cyclobacteriaceae bacterium]